MNTTKLLATSAVLIFIAGTVPSMAQHEGAPQRERAAPAEKIPPQNAPKAGEASHNRGRAETTGQAPREERESRPTDQKSQQQHGKTEQEHRTGLAPREDRPGGASERDRKSDQVQRDERTNSPSQRNRVEQERERSQTTGQASQERERNRAEGSRETTGQGAAGARSTNLAPEKRTRIHEMIVRERSAPRVNSADFEVSVGARVPRTVRFAALPQTIVEIEPEWRGLEYFLIGDRMVIVNPRTMEIVAVVDV